MPVQQDRYEDYLSSYRFFPNSIGFRIISSKAMEKYKNVQSFQLNQLINGKFYFSQDKREILLLKYDMWSRWLVEIENMFIELHDKNDFVCKNDIDNIIMFAKKTSQKYESIIMKEHNDHFDDEFTKIWIEAHQLVYTHMVQEIKEMRGTYEEVFKQLVDLLCGVLQYTLTEIHELNEMFKNKNDNKIFLVLSNYCLKFFREHGICMVTERCKIYKKYFKFNTVWFKNYTDETIPRELVKNVEECGVTVDYKACMFN